MLERQFCATAYIVDKDRVLLIYHRKLQKWLPPGGHIDPNETPAEAAKREALEETGVEIAFQLQENVWIDQANAKSIERPYLCLLEEIPAHGNQPAHQHIDFVFLATPIGGTEKQNHAETEGLKWFTMEEIEKLESEVEIFDETKQVLRNILKPVYEHHQAY